MQEMWHGKGDEKLMYSHLDHFNFTKKKKCRTKKMQNAKGHRNPMYSRRVDSDYTKERKYTLHREAIENDSNFRCRSIFKILPHHVQSRIDTVLDTWLSANHRRRYCLADAMGSALTVFAHGCHQLKDSWQPFLECEFDEPKLLRIVRCYKNTVPEAGVYLGEIVAQFFQHCKQQSNLNVKKQTREADKENSTAGKRDTEFRSNVDRKFEVFMSMKRSDHVTVMFHTIQMSVFPTDRVALYVQEKVFGTLRTREGLHHLNGIEREIKIHEFENKPGAAVFFSVILYRMSKVESKFDAVLDNLFTAVDIYNRSCESVPHRLSPCKAVYCSDILYFKDFNWDIFYDNCVTFLYCFMTDKYKPIVETISDSCVLGLVKILSVVQCSTGCSLKRNHNSKMGHGPLKSVISEGGLNESMKFVNVLFRDAVLNCSEMTHTACTVKTGVLNCSKVTHTACTFKRDNTANTGCNCINDTGPPVYTDRSYNNDIRHYKGDSTATGYRIENDKANNTENKMYTGDFVPMSPTYSPDEEPDTRSLLQPLTHVNKSDSHTDTLGPLCPTDSPNKCSEYTEVEEASIPQTRDKSVGRYFVINEPYINTFINVPVECGNMY